MTWLALLLAGLEGFLWSFAAAQPSMLQPIIPQSRTVEVTLELALDEGLLVNRLNPPEVSLTSPWKASPLRGEVSGEPWAKHPDVYFEHVNPVRWSLTIPAGTPSGQYKASVRAKLGLCKKDSGFCFVQSAAHSIALDVAGRAETNAQPAKITLRFHAPSF